MRNILLALLALTAVCYYFDVSPTDFLPQLPNSEPAKERHASSRQPPPSAQPQPSVASTPASNNSDGSLANRWATPKP